MPPTTAASTPAAPPLPVHGLAATAAALTDRTTTSRALLDVPVTVKDDTDATGQSTPFGTGGAHRTATRDADLVTRLRDAGAIGVPIGAQLLGRTDDEEQLIALAAQLERATDGPAWPALAGMAA